MACYWKCLCCVNAEKRAEKQKLRFSNDLYKDIKLEDLQSEYSKTKNDLESFKQLMQNNALTDNTTSQLYEKKLETKLQHMKGIIYE